MSRYDTFVSRLSYCRGFLYLGDKWCTLVVGLLPSMGLQSRRETLCRTLIVVVVCALVFLFAYRAKTAVYGPSTARITPVTASKLWVSSQKMEPAAQNTAVGLSWAIVLCFFALHRATKPLVRPAIKTPVPALLPFIELQRFLRPPPSVL